MKPQREYAIDFLKFFAAILITNSHLDVYEPSYRLGTGGAIGDVIFLFCSGYTLFIGRMDRFDNWYKRRLLRIFPPVFVWAILSAFCFGTKQTMDYVIINGGGWFVQCILIYYVFAYFIRKYATKNLGYIFLVVALITCVWYFLLIGHETNFNLYGWNYCKWLAFFLFFLQGAALGLHRENLKRPSFGKSLCCLLFCLVFWFSIQYYQTKYLWIYKIQIVSLLPLLGVSYFFYQWCRSELMEKVFNTKIIYQIIRCIGGLCFEIYLVQYTLFHNVVLHFGMSLNIVVILTLIVLWAYILHVCTNFFIQTFRNENYDWRAMIKIY